MIEDNTTSVDMLMMVLLVILLCASSIEKFQLLLQHKSFFPIIARLNNIAVKSTNRICIIMTSNATNIPKEE